jgi:hypothetical protein
LAKVTNALLLISFICIALLSSNCGEKKPDSVTWRTDTQPVKSRLPFLTHIEDCWWISGVAQDRSSGGFPAPSSFFIRGYVKLRAEETSRLVDAYKWTRMSADTFHPSRPPAEYQVLPMSGSLLVSEQLMQSLVASTTFRNGQIVLAPDQNMLYFDLAQD